MLRVVDLATGREREIGPFPPGQVVRVCARGRWDGGRIGLDDVRVLLVADLVRRVLEELHAARVLHAVIVPDTLPDGALAEAVRRLGETLMIRPPAGLVGSPAEATALLGRPADVLVAPADDAGPAGADGTTHIGVGPVAVLPGDQPVSVDGLRTGAGPAAATRLALLAPPYHLPATLGTAGLADATGMLARARRDIAAWADHPSARIPDEVRTTIHAVLDNNLDVAGLLDELRRMRDDPTVPPGAKFETLIEVDRVLAVDFVSGLAGGPDPEV